MSSNSILIWVISFSLLIACKKKSEEIVTEEKAPNILFVIADDMGIDACPGYPVGSVKPNMPTLESLMTEGVRFNNLWSYPTCTPTRASILTGKYGFRTNVLKVDDHLSTSETSLQAYIDQYSSVDYAHAVIGKWHLSNDANHPTSMGIGYYAGLLGGAVQSYDNWGVTENGKTNKTTTYPTTKFTNLAIDWVEQQDKPWFLWLAYNAPHTPFHLPPDTLHSQGVLATDQASIDANPQPYFMAMMEAMDTELGRLLASLSEEERENTIVIFIGDNGTTGKVAQHFNFQRTKGSVYQGGVNVPLIVSGKGVSRINATEDALLHTTDIFATIAEAAGTNTTEVHDSRSFYRLLQTSTTTKREYVYTELGYSTNTKDQAIRNGSHKYIVFEDNSEALFDLTSDSLEKPNLMSVNQLPLSTSDSLIKEELLNQMQLIQQ